MKIMENNESIKQENTGFTILKERLCTETVGNFYGLSVPEITCLLNSIRFSQGGISPMFLSPGYGSNDTLNPQIKITVLSNRPDTYFHELGHALHFKACTVIFEREELCLNAFSLFCQNVLGDKKFVENIKERGTKLQRIFLQKIYYLKNLKDKNKLSPNDIIKSATILGALTYQHAYFVDPRMCEAVASFQDSGITSIIGSINKTAASLIPSPTLSLKGYGDKKSQYMFGRARPFQKALLVKKDDYKREVFFN